MVSRWVLGQWSGSNEVIIGILFVVFLFVLGIFIGKFIAYSLRKLVKKTDIEKKVRPSFVRLIITVIKWSIYIGFLHMALIQLPFDIWGDSMGNVLIVIPAFVAALILIGIGFAIAIYLREVVEESEVKGWKTLSQYLYYFVLGIVGIYAINLALVSVPEMVRNWVTISLITLTAAAVTYVLVHREIKKH